MNSSPTVAVDSYPLDLDCSTPLWPHQPHLESCYISQFSPFPTPIADSYEFEQPFYADEPAAGGGPLGAHGAGLAGYDLSTCQTASGTFGPGRTRSTSSGSASTARSSFYEIILDAPLPIPAQAAAPTLDPSQSNAEPEPSHLVTHLERQASQQATSLINTSFIKERSVVECSPLSAYPKMDDVVEGRHLVGGRRRSLVDTDEIGLAPTPNKCGIDQAMPPTPDPTPLTFTLPRQQPGKVAYVGQELRSQAGLMTSAFARSKEMAISRTLNYGNQLTHQAQRLLRPALARSYSSDDVLPSSSRRSSSAAYSVGSSAHRSSYHPFQQQQAYDEQQCCGIPQFPASTLASPMSLPIDQGQFMPYAYANSDHSSSAPDTPHASSLYSQYYSDGYSAHSPVSPVEYDSGSFVPSSSALLPAASVNAFATRACGPSQYSLSPNCTRALSISTSNLHLSQPPLQPFTLAQSSPVSGPIEGIHPRYRDDLKRSASGKSRKPSQVEDKSHACVQDGCGKTFKRLEHLRRHERTHTHDRPYRCEVERCGRFFSRSDNLTQHRKTHSRQANRLESTFDAQISSSPEGAW